MSKHPIETYLTHLREIRDTGGGSQVIKKWLSYREKGLLGRGLTLDEVETVTQMVRRLAALVALAAESVSYTHLRAHETVLDLVCRLLLEKKTETQNILPLSRCSHHINST